MPIIKTGDRIRLKTPPLSHQLNPATDRPGIEMFNRDDVFIVCGIKGTKISIELEGSNAEPFNWFKSGVKEVLPPEAATEEKPPKPDCSNEPVIECRINNDGSRTATIREPRRLNIHADGSRSVDFDETPVEVEPPPAPKSLQYPDIKAEFKSPITTHHGVEYWIAGTHPKGKQDGEYYYYIRRDGTVTQSEYGYATTVWAGHWARKAIDKLMALQEV